MTVTESHGTKRVEGTGAIFDYDYLSEPPEHSYHNLNKIADAFGEVSVSLNSFKIGFY